MTFRFSNWALPVNSSTVRSDTVRRKELPAANARKAAKISLDKRWHEQINTELEDGYVHVTNPVVR